MKASTSGSLGALFGALLLVTAGPAKADLPPEVPAAPVPPAPAAAAPVTPPAPPAAYPPGRVPMPPPWGPYAAPPPPWGPSPAEPPPPGQGYNTGLIVGGSIVLAMAVASFIGGGYAFSTIASTEGDLQGESRAVGTLLTIHGALCLGGGLAMVLVGARPRRPTDPAPWPPPPQVSLGPGSVSLRGSF